MHAGEGKWNFFSKSRYIYGLIDLNSSTYNLKLYKRLVLLASLLPGLGLREQVEEGSQTGHKVAGGDEEYHKHAELRKQGDERGHGD